MLVPNELTLWPVLSMGTFLKLPGNPSRQSLSPPPSLAGVPFSPLAHWVTDTLGLLSPGPAVAPRERLLRCPSSQGRLGFTPAAQGPWVVVSGHRHCAHRTEPLSEAASRNAELGPRSRTERDMVGR